MAGLDIFVWRQGSTLVPAPAADEEALRKLPLEGIFRISVTRPRRARQSALYWAVCWRIAQLMTDMGADDATKDTVSDRIKIATGHYRIVVLSLGRVAAQGTVEELLEKTGQTDLESMFLFLTERAEAW